MNRPNNPYNQTLMKMMTMIGKESLGLKMMMNQVDDIFTFKHLYFFFNCHKKLFGYATITTNLYTDPAVS